jgi:CAAX protease family protein
MKGLLWDWLPRGWATVAVAIGLLVVSMAFLRTGPLDALRVRTRRRVPESPGLLTRQKVIDYLEDARSGGRELYRFALKLDFGYAAIYTTALVLVLDGTFGVSLNEPTSWRWAVALPLLAGLMDVGENVALLIAVPRDEGSHVGRTSVAAGLSLGKWIFVGATLVLIASGALALTIAGQGAWDPASLIGPMAWTLVVLILGIGVNLAAGLSSTGPATWEKQRRGAIAHAIGALVILLLVVAFDLSWEQAGLGSTQSSCGPWCLGVGGVVAVGLMAAVVAAPSGKRFRDDRFAKLSGLQLAAKILLMIPATVAFEELAFRGFLFHLWKDAFPTSTAIGATAVAFGLWHIMPAVERVRSNPQTDAPIGREHSVIARTVLFGFLRSESGVLWAPALAHWGANSIGVVAVARGAAKASQRPQPPHGHRRPVS